MSVNKSERVPSGKPSKSKRKPVRRAVRKVAKITLYRVLAGPGVDPAEIELTNPALKRAWVLDQELPLPDGHSLHSFAKTMAGPGLYRIEKKDANNGVIEVIGLMIDSTLADRQRGRAVNEPEIDEREYGEPEREEREYERPALRPRPRRVHYPSSSRRDYPRGVNPAQPQQQGMGDMFSLLERWEGLKERIAPPAPAPVPVIREREEVDADPLHSIVRFITEDPDSFREVAGKVRGLFSADGPVVAEESAVGWVDFAMEALPHVGPYIGPVLGQIVGGLANRLFPQAANAQPPNVPGAATGQPQPSAAQAQAGPVAGGSAQADQAAADFVQSLSPKAQLALGTAITELLAALDKNDSPDEFGRRLRGQCEGDVELGPVFAGILGVRTEQLLENVKLTPGGAGPAAKSFALDWLAKMQTAFFEPDKEGGKVA